MAIIFDPDIQFVIDENTTGTTVDTGNKEHFHLRANGTLTITPSLYKVKELLSTFGSVFKYATVEGNDLGLDKVRYVPAYPDEIIALRGDIPSELKPTIDNPTTEFVDTITYKVVRREPAHFGSGGPFTPTNKESKPRLRDPFIKSNEVEGESFEVWGQRFDNLVQFDIWTKSNFEADALADCFETFLLLQTGPLKKAGVAEMKYWARRPDEFIAQWRTPLNVRSIVWYFMTERLFLVKNGVIQTITVDLAGVDSDADI